MLSPYLLLHRLVGILLVLLGLFVLAGWVLRNEVMIRIIPNSPAMAINTALMLVVAGGCLWCAQRGGIARRFYLPGSLLLILLPCAILSQHLLGVDLGIDWVAVHAALGDGHTYPGRTAPNACIGFLAAGLLFCLNRGAAAPRRLRRTSYLLAALPLLIGGLALLGYLLNLQAIYTVATFNRMAMLTGLGIFTLGTGLAGYVGHLNAREIRSPGDSVKQITRLSLALLTFFAIVAGLTGFAVLRQGFEDSSREGLQGSARTDAFIVATELDHGIQLARGAVRRALLRRPLIELNEGVPSEALDEELQEAGISLLELGFGSVEVFDRGGQLLVRAGEDKAADASAGIPLEAHPGVELLWNAGYTLRSSQPIMQGSTIIGVLRAESRLTGLTAFLAEAQALRQTSNVLLCGRIGIEAMCLPNAWQPEETHYALDPSVGPPAPAARAVAGEWGAAETQDGLGALLQAGFAPVPAYPGMGLVVSRPVSELYAPLRERLNLLMLALTGFIAIGTLLLRHWVQPLVEQIAAEQRRIGSILDNSSDAFIALDAAGRITDWNRQAEKLLGFSAADAIGRDMVHLIVPPHQRSSGRPGFESFVEPGAASIVGRRVEVAALHKAGLEVPVELSVASYESGDGYGVSGFLRDLTERREAERRAAEYARELEAAREALVQSQKLEAVGKLTGGVAHDFNNVLQVVRGSLQLLQIECTDNAAVNQRISPAMAAVERGAKLSTQLLAFARKQPLQPKTVNPAVLVRGMGEMLERTIGDAVEMEIWMEEGLWNILADPHQLENVILNLAINARDAMQGHGRLRIDVGNAELDHEYVQSEPGLLAGQYVMIALSDDGPGMPEEVRARAFEPFFTTKPEGEGTGLGLSMAHGFVKQSGGQIRLDSQPGSGTTVRIYLPRSLRAEDRHAPVAAAPAGGGSETILVVEDDPDVQATVVDTLAGLGYRVLRADNAAQALQVIARDPSIDLLFTDVIMPGALRGPELARKARQLLPDLRVLFTSGYTRDAIMHDGRLDPGVHLLSKPYGRDQLAGKLRELLTDRPSPGEQVVPAEGPATIAVVEDDESFRAVVCEMLALLGFDVESFPDAEQAQAALVERQFDILLTDISLPGISGTELASIARQLQPRIQVILASGYGDALGSRLPATYRVLSKPFSLEQLSSQLREACADSTV